MADGTEFGQWYAVYVRSRYEKKVHLALVGEGIESFLPLIEQMRVWSDRKKRVQVPLFPGYIFVRIPLIWKHRVFSKDGVVKFVGVHQHPSAIPEEQMRWIRIIVGSGQPVNLEKCVRIGQRVSVIAGPFKGVKGVVAQVKGSMRVVVSLEVVSQAISVEVAPHYVEAEIEDSVSHAVLVAA